MQQTHTHKAVTGHFKVKSDSLVDGDQTVAMKLGHNFWEFKSQSIDIFIEEIRGQK